MPQLRVHTQLMPLCETSACLSRRTGWPAVQGQQLPSHSRACTRTAGGCIVLPGVTIGEGATVAGGAVVTKDVAPFTVVSVDRVVKILQQAGCVLLSDASRCFPLCKGVCCACGCRTPLRQHSQQAHYCLCRWHAVPKSCCRLAATQPRSSNTCGQERTGAVPPSEPARAARTACCCCMLEGLLQLVNKNVQLVGQALSRHSATCTQRGRPERAAAALPGQRPAGPAMDPVLLRCRRFPRNAVSRAGLGLGAASAPPRHGTLMGRKRGLPPASPSSIAPCCAF